MLCVCVYVSIHLELFLERDAVASAAVLEPGRISNLHHNSPS